MRTYLCRLTAVSSAAVLCLAAAAFADAGKPNSQMQSVLDSLARLGGKPITTLHPQLARLQPSAADAVIQLIQDNGVVAPDKLPPVGKLELISIPGPDGNAIPARVYSPKGDGPFPVIFYIHGGGWVIADIDTYDSSARGLSDLNKAIVVAVEYRKAPEHKFPAAHEDCYAAYQYVAANAGKMHGDASKIAVVGESAGGNLATAVCMMAKQRGGKMPVAQVLVYPITDYNFDTPSYKANANAKPLNTAMMKWFFEQYLNSPADGANVFVSPYRATNEQLKSLPPATIVTAELDPLRSDGTKYAEKLKAAGVDVASKDYERVTHEFFGMAAVVDQAKVANAFVAARLKNVFGGSSL